MEENKKVKLNYRTLECLYAQYNNRKYVHPDPLEFLYSYDDIKDREVVGLIASSLAYGRVAQILKSTSSVLEKMEPSPYLYCKKATLRFLKKEFCGFKHRFTTGEDIAGLLYGIGKSLREFGSLEECFLNGYSPADEHLTGAMEKFSKNICPAAGGRFSLLSSPKDGSACKRLNLFLRWMVRNDDVDPGGWDIPRSKLIVPLDRHMFTISHRIGFTKRKSADLKTAIEITKKFAMFSPGDPVKYDFALTRSGIHPVASRDLVFKKCGIAV